MAETNPLPFPGRPASAVATGGGGPHDPTMEARVAVLEKIAANTEAMLSELRTDVKALRGRQEEDYRALSAKISDESWKLAEKINQVTLKLYIAGAAAAIGILGVMGKGFKWF